MRGAITVVGLGLVFMLAGCDCGGGGVRPVRDGGGSGSVDAGAMLDVTRPPLPDAPWTVGDAYLPPNPDAFFFMDPPPAVCYPDGGMGPWPDPPGGTPDCPDDRAREGCRCETPGATAACWPGPRANRMRGICRDGTATCMPYDEFGGAWGPCVGAVLPVPGVELGPQACECFSMGRWAIDNLSPCFVDYGASGVYAVSTFVSGGTAMCPTGPFTTPPPAPEPGQPWSTNSLTVDCEGHFELCYTLRAGDAATPDASDCEVMRVCTTAWYEEAGVEQELPDLPGWTSTNPTCARAFRDSGGYGEMSVRGFSRECDDIDDGMGGEYVFNRVNYCPIRCNTMPTLPECMGCMMGGSGSF